MTRCEAVRIATAAFILVGDANDYKFLAQRWQENCKVAEWEGKTPAKPQNQNTCLPEPSSARAFPLESPDFVILLPTAWGKNPEPLTKTQKTASAEGARGQADTNLALDRRRI